MNSYRLRGRDKDGKWHIGYFAYDNLGFPQIAELRDDLSMEMHPVERETIGLAIGLRDERGKSIFDGDIVKYFPSPEIEYIGVIKYNIYNAAFQIFTKGGQYAVPGDFILKVIGNIFDNPEFKEFQAL